MNAEAERQKNAAKTRVGVWGADPLQLIGLREILSETGIEVVETRSFKRVRASRLHILLLHEETVADATGVIATLRSHSPGLSVIVLGLSLDPSHIQAIIGAGAKGYVPASATEDEVRLAFSVVEDGSIWAPRKVLARLLDSGGLRPPEGGDHRLVPLFTGREKQVLQLLADGHTNRGIADALGVDAVTVKAHLGRMFRKSGVKNRIELVQATRVRRTP